MTKKGRTEKAGKKIGKKFDKNSEGKNFGSFFKIGIDKRAKVW